MAESCVGGAGASMKMAGSLFEVTEPLNETIDARTKPSNATLIARWKVAFDGRNRGWAIF
jgi:hypothetical protein